MSLTFHRLLAYLLLPSVAAATNYALPAVGNTSAVAFLFSFFFLGRRRAQGGYDVALPGGGGGGSSAPGFAWIFLDICFMARANHKMSLTFYRLLAYLLLLSVAAARLLAVAPCCCCCCCSCAGAYFLSTL